MAETSEQGDHWPRGLLYDWLRTLPGGRVLGGAVALIVGAWFFFLIVPPLFFGRADSGQLGDTFGMMNGLIGGLTLLGAGYAIYGQNEQLKLAHKQIEDADKERRETIALLARQTEALLDAAKLQAVNAIGQMDNASFQYHMLDERKRLSLRLDHENVMISRQYAKILLNDLETQDFHWGNIPMEKRSKLRKFYLVTVRRARESVLEVEISNKNIYIDSLRAILTKIADDLSILRYQADGESAGTLIWNARILLKQALEENSKFTFAAKHTGSELVSEAYSLLQTIEHFASAY